MGVPMALVWFFFGNGRGLKSPLNNDILYWLDGRFYTWNGWFGAQLQSIEWAAPKAGTRRRINGRHYTIFHTERRWLAVRCAWALDDLPNEPDAANKVLHLVRSELTRP